MRIFVTGGTGFIGRALAARLQKDGHRLLLLMKKSEPNNFRLRPSSRVTFIKGDLANINKWSRKVKRFRPEAAVHLAWEGLRAPDYSTATSIKNLTHGLRLMNALAEAGCKKVLYAGSCWEYGAKLGKVNEDMGVKPMNAFSAAKNALHWLGAEIAKEKGMQFIWTRFFFVYGPGQRPGALIPSLIESMRRGVKPEIKNPRGGNDFIYVDDAVRALAMIIKKRIRFQNVTYNIGSGRLTGVQKIADEVYGRRGRAPRKVSGFYADISKIRREIGWKPKISMAAGIKNMIKANNYRPSQK